MSFELLNAFKEKKFICNLDLSTVLLEDKEIPWILLIPKVENALQITDLSFDNQIALLKEINLCSSVMKELFECDQLNIASIGNKTPQLHVHIICRTTKDPLWPQTVWDKALRGLSESEGITRAGKIRESVLKKQRISPHSL